MSENAQIAVCVAHNVLHNIVKVDVCMVVFMSTHCPLAGRSDIPGSLYDYGFRFISASATSGSPAFLCKVCTISIPLILPTQFIIEQNLQCISPGIPCVSNGVAGGCTLIKPH